MNQSTDEYIQDVEPCVEDLSLRINVLENGLKYSNALPLDKG